jgi:hypothetical protein
MRCHHGDAQIIQYCTDMHGVRERVYILAVKTPVMVPDLLCVKTSALYVLGPCLNRARFDS